jgi:hypothetical protein
MAPSYLQRDMGLGHQLLLLLLLLLGLLGLLGLRKVN